MTMADLGFGSGISAGEVKRNQYMPEGDGTPTAGDIPLAAHRIVGASVLARARQGRASTALRRRDTFATAGRTPALRCARAGTPAPAFSRKESVNAGKGL